MDYTNLSLYSKNPSHISSLDIPPRKLSKLLTIWSSYQNDYPLLLTKFEHAKSKYIKYTGNKDPKDDGGYYTYVYQPIMSNHLLSMRGKKWLCKLHSSWSKMTSLVSKSSNDMFDIIFEFITIGSDNGDYHLDFQGNIINDDLFSELQEHFYYYMITSAHPDYYMSRSCSDCSFGPDCKRIIDIRYVGDVCVNSHESLYMDIHYLEGMYKNFILPNIVSFYKSPLSKELLFSPNLPKWFKNNFSSSQDDFNQLISLHN